ncbi:unnamed protein product [Rhizoctonia solani]|uniref:Nephrocystin 3-like N-terminal domain-containing protein n=1 Tax=Rhizoctonia solani TaxID=456999 RepID=A0A8H3BVT7_9AGAM|nr:unnamed protein product [Rhizoctonia solani]
MLQNLRLEGLAPSHNARYDSRFANKIDRGACHPNTRATVLQYLFDRGRSPGDMVEWMIGMVGTGKTSIAYSFCKELERNGQLGASFFCCRASAECKEVSRIVPTIAYQLAHRSTPFKFALSRILDRMPNIAERDIETQFEQLIQIPLMEVKEELPKHFIVVIDALEECLDSGTVTRLLDILFQCSQLLPIKFFLTSRPEPAILHPSFTDNKRCCILDLDQLDKTQVTRDIKTVLSDKLSSLQLPEIDLQQLAEQSGGLFIFAAILAKYILSREPGAVSVTRLAAVLGRVVEGYGDMDNLYKTILEPLLLLHDKEPRRIAEVEHMKQVFWTVLCAREPLSKDTLVALTGLKHAWAFLQWFRSVLHISEDEGTVSIIHASLPEFIFSAERSGPLACDEQTQNACMAKMCFDLMKRGSGLRFNIGDIPTLNMFDEDVSQLGITLQKNIPAALSYACLRWSDHLKASGPCEAPPAPQELLLHLYDFLGERLLFWIEVMNLKGWMSQGPIALMEAQNWVTRGCGELDKVLKFLHDSHSFVTTFAASSVCQSTLHVYTSLAFVSRESEVWRHYSTRVNCPIQVDGTIVRQREGAALATKVIGACATALACSPDNKLIAVGTADGTIQLSYLYNGAHPLKTFRAHSDRVNSLLFFSGGDFIVSGSQDSTVGIWKVGTCTQVPELRVRLQEHNFPVNSVAIAPNGTCIASASDDKTVRLWNPRDYTAPTRLLEGHRDRVTSIQISPGSNRLISGCRDSTIRLWDLSTATQLADLCGHTGCVTSVIFAANDECVISGSSDGTIRVWHVQRGVLFQVDVLAQCLGGINSLALSADGKRIVSGGQDRKLRMWDTYHGRLIAGPFDGHSGDITSLAFSSDNAHVVSVSLDSTMKLWDVRPSTVLVKQSQGCTSEITSVALSGDGSLIASGANDHTINVWESSDGALYSGPLIGHKESVTSIAFSKSAACQKLFSGSRDCTALMWSVQTGVILFALIHVDEVNSVTFSPDDTLVASGSTNIQLWDSHSGTRVGNPLIRHENSVTSLAFSGDNRLLVSGSIDQKVFIWDVRNGTQIAGPFYHPDGVTTVAFSPDLRLVMSGSWDGKIRVWRWSDGALAATLGDGTDDTEVKSLALSTDGAYLVSGFSDGRIRVWSMPSGRLITTPFNGHKDCVTSVAFFPNKPRIISGSRDRTVRVWQIPSDNEQHTWDTNPAGWIIEHPSRPILHLPADLRDSVPQPPNILTIDCRGSISLSLRGGTLDNLWQ